MKPYQMIRDGRSMTSLVMAHHQGRATQQQEEEAVAAATTITSGSISTPSTLMTFSKTINNAITTFTPTPTRSTKPTTRNTLTATSRLTVRP